MQAKLHNFLVNDYLRSDMLAIYEKDYDEQYFVLNSKNTIMGHEFGNRIVIPMLNLKKKWKRSCNSVEVDKILEQFFANVSNKLAESETTLVVKDLETGIKIADTTFQIRGVGRLSHIMMPSRISTITPPTAILHDMRLECRFILSNLITNHIICFADPEYVGPLAMNHNYTQIGAFINTLGIMNIRIDHA